MSAATPAAAGSPGPVVVWFRSDLRTRDNTALAEAARDAADRRAPLVGLYLVCPEEWRDHEMGPPKVSFMLRSAAALRDALAAGPAVPLVVRTVGDAGADRESHTAAAAEAAAQACEDLGAASVHYNVQYEVNELARDRLFGREAEARGFGVRGHHDQCVVQPGTLLSGSDSPYKVYTPFRKKWIEYVRSRRRTDEDVLALRASPPKQELAAEAEELARRAGRSEPLPACSGGVRGHEAPAPALKKSLDTCFPAGEEEAHRRLAAFVAHRGREYDARRNAPGDAEGTSRLSPYLSAGVVSARQCVVAAAAANRGQLDGGSAGLRVWIQELVWREFYREVLFSFPRVGRDQPFQAYTRTLAWREDEDELERWRQGRTGYPIVDAGMRELLATGYMHNRSRMVTAMFLTKHLLMHWRHGERHFARYLVDLDNASNNGGWQWSSSSGTDAQPYFRIFAPVRQGERFDPRGDYVRRWVPELAGLPDRQIHAPWEHLSPAALEKIGYCAPIVDHREARERCLAAFKVARTAFDSAKGAAAEAKKVASSSSTTTGRKRAAGAASPARKRRKRAA